MRKYFIVYTETERAAFIRRHEEEWRRVGNEIKTIRQHLRISQKRLAQAAGICDKTLRKLERGQYITRFKTVAASCKNSLLAIAYSDFLRTTQTMVGGQA